MTGEELRKIRQEIGFTQARAAAEIGVTVTTVSLWENNHKKIHPTVAKGIIASLKPYYWNGK